MKYLKSVFNELLDQATFKVLNFSENEFSPFGYTALWLLSESHFAIHTFPEHHMSYIELSSCNALKHEIFERLMLEKFELWQTSENVIRSKTA
jgi:S-adenosylmethionine/arginine decarboxylase-like enzyme